MRALTCFMFLTVPALLPAQRMEARFEAGVATYADEGAVNHFAAGGSLRTYLSRRWSVDPEFLHQRHNSGFVRDRENILWGNFAFDFLHRERAVVPYWFGGPGLVNHRTSAGGRTFSKTEAGFGTGAGVRFFFGRVFVAPQVRFGLADGVFGELTGSLGFIVRK